MSIRALLFALLAVGLVGSCGSAIAAKRKAASSNPNCQYAPHDGNMNCRALGPNCSFQKCYATCLQNGGPGHDLVNGHCAYLCSTWCPNR